ncbi:MAG: DNA-3-methyladenine glycosylase family protein [Betaproteobacteria bacterium]
MSLVVPKIETRRDDVVISGISPFNLKETLESGQAFRWDVADGLFTGVVRGRVIRAVQEGDSLVLVRPGCEEVIRLAIDYFSLDVDQASIEERLCNTDPTLDSAVRSFSGLRLLRQEPWECLVSFILSARNAIPLIRRAVERIARAYGDPIFQESDDSVQTDDGSGPAQTPYYSFPTPGRLASADVLDLVRCGAGFRSQYVKAAAERVASGGIDFQALRTLGYEGAKEKLMGLRGVGEKVADCVLLFSLGFYQAFPIDVWMTRVMRYVYFGGSKVSAATIAQFARERFGELAGYAQQFLFHYARRKLAPELRGLDLD